MDSASEILALTLIFVVHVVGGLMLVWGMLDSDHGPRWWRRDDGPDDPPPPAPRPPAPRSVRSPLPLPGAEPSRVRLRDDDVLLRDAHPRAPRRPGREPGPDRSPARR